MGNIIFVKKNIPSDNNAPSLEINVTHVKTLPMNYFDSNLFYEVKASNGNACHTFMLTAVFLILITGRCCN